jgi:hypothetical protein
MEGKRNMKKIQLQGVILIITAMLSAVLLSACGKNPEDKELIPKPGTKQEAETEAETEVVGSADVDWDDFCGNWMLVGFLSKWNATLNAVQKSPRKSFPQSCLI